MKNHDAAALARVLLIVDAAGRAAAKPVSDRDLARLAYFVDALSPLWALAPLERFRLKVEEPHSGALRRATNRLVLSGVIVPSEVGVQTTPPRLTARYVVDDGRASPVLRAIRATSAGRREAELVEEVVYALSGMLDYQLDDAVHRDASYGNPKIGPSDVVDLGDGKTVTAAQRFVAGASGSALIEAQLVHLYAAHLERVISAD